jgi:hypothetical protein
LEDNFEAAVQKAALVAPGARDEVSPGSSRRRFSGDGRPTRGASASDRVDEPVAVDARVDLSGFGCRVASELAGHLELGVGVGERDAACTRETCPGADKAFSSNGAGPASYFTPTTEQRGSTALQPAR